MLIAGMSAFFPPPPRACTAPAAANASEEEKEAAAMAFAEAVAAARPRPAWCLLLFACLSKQQAEAPPAMTRFTHALMHWLAAQPCVSSLVVASDPASDGEG